MAHRAKCIRMSRIKIEDISREYLMNLIVENIEINERGCWIWAQSLGTNGYGQLSVLGRCRKAHRVSQWAFNGDLDPTLEVIHSCDDKRCVKPAHLSMGTRKENARQAADRLLNSGWFISKNFCKRGHDQRVDTNRYSDNRGKIRCRICRNIRAAEKGRLKRMKDRHLSRVKNNDCP